METPCNKSFETCFERQCDNYKKCLIYYEDELYFTLNKKDLVAYIKENGGTQMLSERSDGQKLGKVV